MLDALTIGLVCAVGTTKALSHDIPAEATIFPGALSVVGGSPVRVMLLNRSSALMIAGSLFALAASAAAGASWFCTHSGCHSAPLRRCVFG